MWSIWRNLHEFEPQKDLVDQFHWICLVRLFNLSIIPCHLSAHPASKPQKLHTFDPRSLPAFSFSDAQPVWGPWPSNSLKCKRSPFSSSCATRAPAPWLRRQLLAIGVSFLVVRLVPHQQNRQPVLPASSDPGKGRWQGLVRTNTKTQMMMGPVSGWMEHTRWTRKPARVGAVLWMSVGRSMCETIDSNNNNNKSRWPKRTKF